ncbi:hypothetical protein BESB_027480 [Besnoitia besnoiti]|uniref:Zinc finger protein 36 family 3 protein n=1 Tax=Besnoitia besnoiti TaxID=94643 RepID=A0A2A9M6Q3_BESBE|nr:uncharacterized protein BESB_027480 [Besnoitia besnoiti]PFH31313.1 hypothetical protein BESB_027480 [Besnoitia besnoiti]
MTTMQSFGSRRRSASVGEPRDCEGVPSSWTESRLWSDDELEAHSQGAEDGSDVSDTAETSSFVAKDGADWGAWRGLSLSALFKKGRRKCHARGRKRRGSGGRSRRENLLKSFETEKLMALPLPSRGASLPAVCTAPTPAAGPPSKACGGGEIVPSGKVTEDRLQRFLPFAPQHIHLFLVSYFCYAILYSTRKPFSVVKEDVHRQLGLSTYSLGCVDTSFLAMYAIGQFILPPALANVRLSIGLGACYLASAFTTLAFGLSSSPAFLVLWWGLNGIAHAAVFPLLVKVLTERLSKAERGRAMGLWTTSQQTGAIASTAFAAFVASRMGWRAVFLLSALICGLATLLLFFCMPSSSASPPRIAPGEPFASQASREAHSRLSSQRRKQGFSLLSTQGSEERERVDTEPDEEAARSDFRRASDDTGTLSTRDERQRSQVGGASEPWRQGARGGSRASHAQQKRRGLDGEPASLPSPSRPQGPASSETTGVFDHSAPPSSLAFVSASYPSAAYPSASSCPSPACSLSGGARTQKGASPSSPDRRLASLAASPGPCLSEEEGGDRGRSPPHDLFRQSGGTGDSDARAVCEAEAAPKEAAGRLRREGLAPRQRLESFDELPTQSSDSPFPDSLSPASPGASTPSPFSGLELAMSAPHIRGTKKAPRAREAREAQEGWGDEPSCGPLCDSAEEREAEIRGRDASREASQHRSAALASAASREPRSRGRSTSPSKEKSLHAAPLPHRTLAGAAAEPAPRAAMSFFSIVWNVPFVLCCSCAYFIIKLIRYSLLFWLPFFLAKEARMKAAAAGYASMIFDIGGIGGAVAGGFLADRVMKGRRLTCATAMSLLTGFSLLLLAFACQQQQTLLHQLEEETLLQVREFQHLQETQRAALARFQDLQKKSRLQLPLRLQQSLEQEESKKQAREEETRARQRAAEKKESEAPVEAESGTAEKKGEAAAAAAAEGGGEGGERGAGDLLKLPRADQDATRRSDAGAVRGDEGKEKKEEERVKNLSEIWVKQRVDTSLADLEPPGAASSPEAAPAPDMPPAPQTQAREAPPSPAAPPPAPLPPGAAAFEAFPPPPAYPVPSVLLPSPSSPPLAASQLHPALPPVAPLAPEALASASHPASSPASSVPGVLYAPQAGAETLQALPPSYIQSPQEQLPPPTAVAAPLQYAAPSLALSASALPAPAGIPPSPFLLSPPLSAPAVVSSLSSPPLPSPSVPSVSLPSPSLLAPLSAPSSLSPPPPSVQYVSQQAPAPGAAAQLGSPAAPEASPAFGASAVPYAQPAAADTGGPPPAPSLGAPAIAAPAAVSYVPPQAEEGASPLAPPAFLPPLDAQTGGLERGSVPPAVSPSQASGTLSYALPPAAPPAPPALPAHATLGGAAPVGRPALPPPVAPDALQSALTGTAQTSERLARTFSAQAPPPSLPPPSLSPPSLPPPSLSPPSLSPAGAAPVPAAAQPPLVPASFAASSLPANAGFPPLVPAPRPGAESAAPSPAPETPAPSPSSLAKKDAVPASPGLPAWAGRPLAAQQELQKADAETQLEAQLLLRPSLQGPRPLETPPPSAPVLPAAQTLAQQTAAGSALAGATEAALVAPPPQVGGEPPLPSARAAAAPDAAFRGGDARGRLSVAGSAFRRLSAAEASWAPLAARKGFEGVERRDGGAPEGGRQAFSGMWLPDGAQVPPRPAVPSPASSSAVYGVASAEPAKAADAQGAGRAAASRAPDSGAAAVAGQTGLGGARLEARADAAASAGSRAAVWGAPAQEGAAPGPPSQGGGEAAGAVEEAKMEEERRRREKKEELFLESAKEKIQRTQEEEEASFLAQQEQERLVLQEAQRQRREKKEEERWNELFRLLLFMFAVGFCIASPDSILGATAAQDLVERSGTTPGPNREKALAVVAAFINGMGAVGALLQGVCTASVAEQFGWDALFGLLCVLSMTSALLLLPACLEESRAGAPLAASCASSRFLDCQGAGACGFPRGGGRAPSPESKPLWSASKPARLYAQAISSAFADDLTCAEARGCRPEQGERRRKKDEEKNFEA